MSTLPNAPSCERNREPILEVLRTAFASAQRVLEVGSGTGQHAVHFAAAMPWLQWQCSDRPEYLSGIRAWLAHAALPNTPEPLELDVAQGPWPAPTFNAAFSANTLHIMGWSEVEQFFSGLNSALATDATLVAYGPFNYGGQFTSESNRAFDASLKSRDTRMGIRDAEAVDALAKSIGLRLADDIAMPANNRCRVWKRGSTLG